MKTQNNLLDKYYRGETSLEEEKMLMQELMESDNNPAEKDMFSYYSAEINVPDNLEQDIAAGWESKINSQGRTRIRFIGWSSVAAAVVIAFTILFNVQDKKNTRLENEFFVMEQALFNVSESIRPQEQEDMLVLWVDDNVEIIVN